METSGPCAVCSSISTFRCSGCVDGPFYCSKDHQKSDWKSSHRYSCGSKYIEKVIDPTSPYGEIYKAKIPIPIGTVLFRKKPILTFPRRLTQIDWRNSPLVRAYGETAASLGYSIRGENIVPCLECNMPIPYDQVMGCSDPKSTNNEIEIHVHKCYKCKWATHNGACVTGAGTHDEECKIFQTNSIDWKIYRFMQGAGSFTLIGILRAVLLKKNKNPIYEQLIRLHLSKKLPMSLELQRMIPEFIFNKCKLKSVISKPELEKLSKIILSNYLSVTHRPSHESKFAWVIFGDPGNPNGRILPHSCMANCGITYERKTLVGTFTTRRNIEAGETLTLNYDPMLADSPLRGSKSRLEWLASHGVECPCVRCNTTDEGGTMYNAIRCQNDKCPGQGQGQGQSEPSYMIPVEQTPNDCDYKCLVCDHRIPHAAMRKVQEEIGNMILFFEERQELGGLKQCLKKFIFQKVHPNHFLALRALEQVCLMAFKLIFPYGRYCIRIPSGNVHFNPAKFVYSELFLKDFEDYLTAVEKLSGVPKSGSGYFSFVIGHSCLRLESIAKELLHRGSRSGELDQAVLNDYTDQLIDINANMEFALALCKSDPISISEEYKAYEALTWAYIKFLQFSVQPILDKVGEDLTLIPPIYQTLFGKLN